MPEVVNLLHASLLVADLARSRDFYEGLLGLKPSPARPEMSFTGIWYDVGAAQIHLICLPNPDPVTGRPAHGGRDRHTALGVRGFAELRARLDAVGVSYTLSQSGRGALFVRDPDGNALELVAVV
ncbi:MAG: glyoxalase [Hydrogenophilales bacterium 28-61-23]|nr:MAG: glyoxalase [Hydrogenophilales bacterium 28-61-23]